MDTSEDTKGSLHCCACDISFHARWYEEEGRFEELCPKCLSISLETGFEDDIDTLIEALEKGYTLGVDYGSV